MEYGHTFEVYWESGIMTRIMVKATSDELAIIELYKIMRHEVTPFTYRKVG
jgi:hypothetical protein